MFTAGIETFLAVVRSQSISKAAKELNLAQTSVSQRLKIIEREFGMTLIERGKGIRQIRLTPAGEEFFKLAEQWSHIERQARILQKQGPTRSLLLGSVDSLNTFLLPTVYRSLTNHDRPIRLSIRTSHSVDLYTEVERRQVDVALVLRELIYPNVHVTKCFSSPMVVLRLATSAQPKSPTVHPSELDVNYGLFMPWGPGFDSWHEYWWDPYSPSCVRLDSITLLLSLIQDYKQWTIIPLWIAIEALKRGNYFIYHLTDPPPDYSCYKLTHKQPTSHALQCLDIFNRYFQQAIQRLI
ncbi:MAG: LysR family transcriptional regulator [Negativicutes bacterium]|nr:LysR family transcriptional regulator [Negativicutes bacterium]